MNRIGVAILGGGLAGLNAARLLHRAGRSFRLFEARDRFGGRILTVDRGGAPSGEGFDLGPSWFWPAMQPEFAHLVADLGLRPFPQAVAGDFLFERHRDEPAQRGNGAAFDQGSMRIAGGTGALIRALVQGLPSDCLHLAAPVTRLRLVEDGVVLTVAPPGGPETQWQAARVIAALPPRLLAERVALEPAADAAVRDRWRATPTWMAPHAKLVAVYDRPFWRDAGLSGMAQSLAGPLAEIHDATTASGEAALFGFVGLPSAQRAALGEAEVIRRACDQLARLFGPLAARPRATLLKDWAADPDTATAADAAASAHPAPSRLPWVTGAWAARLAVAGSEASATEPGYLAGAAEASARAARAPAPAGQG